MVDNAARQKNLIMMDIFMYYEINNGKRDFKVCELEVFKVNVG